MKIKLKPEVRKAIELVAWLSFIMVFSLVIIVTILFFNLYASLTIWSVFLLVLLLVLHFSEKEKEGS